MKRDDQILALRTANDRERDRLVQNARDIDRALNVNGDTAKLPNEDTDEPEEELLGSKIIVVHPGSQNFRIGFASDALPKTVSSCIASSYPKTESESLDALPRRQVYQQKPEQQQLHEWHNEPRKMASRSS